MTWLLDLDGVVWTGDRPIPGSIEAIERLRTKQRVMFLTNNSSATVAQYAGKMKDMGLSCAADDICTSAQAAALLVEPGETALVCAGPGVVEALEARGVTCVRDPVPGIDCVVVGWDRNFDFSRLTAAFRAVHAGARLIGTNDDPTYPAPDGELPGGGSLVAAVAYAGGVTPTFGGKPFAPAARLVFDRLGWAEDPSRADRESLWMIGDRPSTDGKMAVTLGARFGLVFSGVTAPIDAPFDPIPTATAANLAEFVAEHAH